jgi:hypothetical protein
MRNSVWRSLRIAALAVTVTLACGSVAWGQNYGHGDDSYYNRGDEAREQGYRRGYDDGQRAGQFDAERGRHFKFKNDAWEDSRGFEHWMGNKGHYKQAYRDGYERGYRLAYGSNERRGYRDDDRYRDRDDWR